MDKLITGPEAHNKWLPALSNEWGRLANGNENNVLCHNAIKFVSFETVPKHRKTTYASFVCDHRPFKEEPWRIRLVVGGDKLDYPWDTGSPATDITEIKILFNIEKSRNLLYYR